MSRKITHKDLHNFKINIRKDVIDKLCKEYFKESHINIVENAKLSLEADEDTGVDDIPSEDKIIYAIKRALLCTIIKK